MAGVFGYALAALGGAAVAQKVMTELFRDPHVPTGAINVNAENGVVLLRGEIEEPAMIMKIVTRTRRIRGVADVENLMHLPGESVPRS